MVQGCVLKSGYGCGLDFRFSPYIQMKPSTAVLHALNVLAVIATPSLFGGAGGREMVSFVQIKMLLFVDRRCYLLVA